MIEGAPAGRHLDFSEHCEQQNRWLRIWRRPRDTLAPVPGKPIELSPD